MATLLLSTAGAAIGGTLGGPTGAAIGSTIGAVGGSYIDNQLYNSSDHQPKQSSPDEIHIQTSMEGQPIQRVFGTVRIAGEVIWATSFSKHSSGGEGKGGGASNGGEEYYSGSLAIALCEGEIESVTRIWADGQILDLTDINYRLYKGTPDQDPDPIIELTEGSAPAYRNIAYIVFEEMDLSPFGNRVPQFNFEVTRPYANPFHRGSRGESDSWHYGMGI